MVLTEAEKKALEKLFFISSCLNHFI